MKNEVGAINTEDCKVNDALPTNLLEFGFGAKEERFHEAQKPLELIDFLIKLTTKENQIVLDPFMGSGTTTVASQNLNRQFIGFEINQNYYENSLKRIDSTSPTPTNRRLSKAMPLFEAL
ncbi:MAG: site-specific DNA-methyltransferase [Hydrococcus sp. RU_2_2]|nr:site-specific DNA-methyltransferase [Hydrococcus sp. RU_2_2]